MTEKSRADLYLVPWVLEMLGQHSTQRSLQIVDVGCGDGYVATKLAASGYTVRGFDTSETDIATAKAEHAGIDFSMHSVYEKSLPAQIGPVDCVIALEILEHLYNPRELFRFCQDVLKPGGLLLLTTPYHGYLKNLALSLTNGWDRHVDVALDGGHIKFFSRRTLEAMISETSLKTLRVDGIGRLPYLWKSMGVVAQSRMVSGVEP